MHWKTRCCLFAVSKTKSLSGPIDTILPSACATLSPYENIGPISATAPTQTNDRLPISKNTKIAAATRGKIDGVNCVSESFKKSPLVFVSYGYVTDTYSLYIDVFHVMLQYVKISQNVSLPRLRNLNLEYNMQGLLHSEYES